MANELILIVEDNDKNLKLVRDVLKYYGYRTMEAMNGRDALDVARLHGPALILMDIQLPEMDGITAFERLRADSNTKQIPVIAVTASATSVDRKRIMEAGFDGYQAKPIQVKEFVQEVKKALARRSTG
jgi:two-component system, cell cycle response regulator DivK